jgi:hypothetical protein
MNMTNNQLVNAFIARLESFKPGAALREKYIAEYKRLLALRSDTRHSVDQHLEHIKFGCFCTGTDRISTEKKLLRALVSNKPVRLETATGVSATENLLNARITATADTPKNLRPLSKIRVYQEPAKGDLPCLTLKELVTQIPRSLVKKTTVVCLLAEDENIVRDSYNILMGAYEYNIWLFGN